MAETVTTGGTKTFHYGKDHNPKLNKEQKKEIRGAYEQYYERKRREKKRKNIIIALIIVLVILATLAVIFLRN